MSSRSWGTVLRLCTPSGSPRVGSTAFANAFDLAVGKGAGLFGAFAGQKLPLFIGTKAAKVPWQRLNAPCTSVAVCSQYYRPGQAMLLPLMGVWRIVSAQDPFAAVPPCVPSSTVLSPLGSFDT
jgi:hypothetical protein